MRQIKEREKRELEEAELAHSPEEVERPELLDPERKGLTLSAEEPQDQESEHNNEVVEQKQKREFRVEEHGSGPINRCVLEGGLWGAIRISRNTDKVREYSKQIRDARDSASGERKRGKKIEEVGRNVMHIDELQEINELKRIEEGPEAEERELRTKRHENRDHGDCKDKKLDGSSKKLRGRRKSEILR